MEENLKFKVKKVFDEELKQEWYYLSKLSELSIFQTFEWQHTWHKSLNEPNNKDNLFIVSIYFGRKIIAIVPFIKYECFKTKILTLTGLPFADYCDCLIDQTFFTQNQKAKYFINEYFLKIKDIDLIIIDKIKEGSNFFYLVDEKNFREDNFKSYQIIKNTNSEEIIPKKVASDTKRQIKRLKEIGSLSFEIVKSEEDKKKIIDFFFEKKEKQLKTTNNWNYLKNKKNKNFIYNICTFSSNCHLSWLLLNEKIIAAHLGYFLNNKMFYIFPVYDPTYSKFSPGNILLYNLIEKFFSESGQIFDFTTGDEIYKIKISNNINRIFYNYTSLTIKGKIASIFLTVFNYLRKIKLLKTIYNKVKY